MATLSIANKLQDPTSDEAYFIRRLTKQPNNAFESYFDFLANRYAKKGWTRKYFYELCINAMQNVEDQSLQFSLLDNFITGLTGECHPNYIIRLPGDPTGKNQFLAYVYSREWQ